jgi:hypothetical protein
MIDEQFDELWLLDEHPHLLAKLGLQYEDGHVTGSARGFITRNNDGRTYLLDIPWLDEMGGDATKLSEADLVKLACAPARAGEVDRAVLLKELKQVGAEASQACQ